MTQPAETLAPSTPAAAPPAAPVRATSADRVAALRTKLEKLDSAPESPDAEKSPAAIPPGSEAESSAPETTPDAEVEARKQRAADRLARIQQVRAKDEAKRLEREQRTKYRRDDGEAEKLRKRIAELEPMEQAWSSPLAMLEWAEKKGIKAPDLVTVLRDKLTDPNAIAERQAKSVEERTNARIAELEKRLEQSEAQRRAEAQQAAEQAEGARRAGEFVNLATTKTDEAPYTARFLKKHGANGLIAFANKWVAPMLPEDYDLPQLHDHVEQLLEELQLAADAAESTPGATSPKNPAGTVPQPAVTLNNRTAAGRESVVEAKPLHTLPKAERIRLAREKYER